MCVLCVSETNVPQHNLFIISVNSYFLEHLKTVSDPS